MMSMTDMARKLSEESPKKKQIVSDGANAPIHAVSDGANAPIHTFGWNHQQSGSKTSTKQCGNSCTENRCPRKVITASCVVCCYERCFRLGPIQSWNLFQWHTLCFTYASKNECNVQQHEACPHVEEGREILRHDIARKSGLKRIECELDESGNSQC